MTYCSCETPVMDIETDTGCRRCGLPVDFNWYPLCLGRKTTRDIEEAAQHLNNSLRYAASRMDSVFRHDWLGRIA